MHGSPTGTLVYGVLCAAVLLAVRITRNSARPIERDVGGYDDTFETFYRPPYDKARHAGGAFVLTLAAVLVLDVAPLWAGALTVAAGVGFEYAAGWPSWRDVVADLAGAALAVLVLAVPLAGALVALVLVVALIMVQRHDDGH